MIRFFNVLIVLSFLSPITTSAAMAVYSNTIGQPSFAYEIPAVTISVVSYGDDQIAISAQKSFGQSMAFSIVLKNDPAFNASFLGQQFLQNVKPGKLVNLSIVCSVPQTMPMNTAAVKIYEYNSCVIKKFGLLN